jgi:hypothetical protein
VFLKQKVSNDYKVTNPPSGTKINHKNNLGFNSHIDFYPDSIHTDDYAIIGDSFVDSYQSGVNNSIAFFLDDALPNKVYNFGVTEGNINDYYTIYDNYNLKRLKKVFILLTGTNDLIYSEPFKNEAHQILGINLKSIYLLEQKINQSKRFAKPNYQLIHNEYRNTVIMVHSGLNKKVLRQCGIDLDMIQLELGDEFKFEDGHYTPTGNKKISEIIISYLNKTNDQIETRQ